MLKNYKMGFDIWGLLLFLVIMIPNFYWFAVHAPNDILRTESSTPFIDTIASISQILVVASLCIFINNKRKKFCVTPLIIATAISCLLYFLVWILYYNGIINAISILALCILPCLAFLFFAVDRKNMIAIVPIFIFAICHTIFGIANFIL